MLKIGDRKTKDKIPVSMVAIDFAKNFSRLMSHITRGLPKGRV